MAAKKKPIKMSTGGETGGGRFSGLGGAGRGGSSSGGRGGGGARGGSSGRGGGGARGGSSGRGGARGARGGSSSRGGKPKTGSMSEGGESPYKGAKSWKEAHEMAQSMRSPQERARSEKFNATFESKLKIAQSRIMASGNNPKVAAAESDKLMKWVNEQSKKKK